MNWTLPPLPYDKKALEPHISAETLDYHYGKHHQNYVNQVNLLKEGTPYDSVSLEDIILKSSGALYNNAAQTWNHSFYWLNLQKPSQNFIPEGAFRKALCESFGSVEQFQENFMDAGKTLFGSGWVFLSQKKDGSLILTKESNGGCPLTQGLKPLLTCDVWEHAYYVDYRNDRALYLKKFWDMVSWKAVEGHFARDSHWVFPHADSSGGKV